MCEIKKLIFTFFTLLCKDFSRVKKYKGLGISQVNVRFYVSGGEGVGGSQVKVQLYIKEAGKLQVKITFLVAICIKKKNHNMGQQDILKPYTGLT